MLTIDCTLTLVLSTDSKTAVSDLENNIKVIYDNLLQNLTFSVTFSQCSFYVFS
jgi:hypothetical protein